MQSELIAIEAPPAERFNCSRKAGARRRAQLARQKEWRKRSVSWLPAPMPRFVFFFAAYMSFCECRLPIEPPHFRDAPGRNSSRQRKQDGGRSPRDRSRAITDRGAGPSLAMPAVAGCSHHDFQPIGAADLMDGEAKSAALAYQLRKR